MLKGGPSRCGKPYQRYQGRYHHHHHLNHIILVTIIGINRHHHHHPCHDNIEYQEPVVMCVPVELSHHCALKPGDSQHHDHNHDDSEDHGDD